MNVKPPFKKTIDGLRPIPRASDTSRSFVRSPEILVDKHRAEKLKDRNITNKQQKYKTKDFIFSSRLYSHGRKLWHSKFFWRIFATFFTITILFFVINKLSVIRIELRPHIQIQNVSDTGVSYRYSESGHFQFESMVVQESVQVPIQPIGIREVFGYASGSVKVYNYYSTEPQRLLPETRFVSTGGKTFLLGRDSVVIPGRVGDTPGEIEITVYAEHPGESYNIDATDFTLPGFKELGLLDKYEKVYASSLEPFSGGFVETESYVSSLQKNEVMNENRELLLTTLNQRIEYEYNPMMYLFDKDIQYHFFDPILQEQGGVFYLELRAQAKVFFLHKNSVEEYIKKHYIDEPEKELFRIRRFHPVALIDLSNFHDQPKEIPFSFEMEILTRSILSESAFIQDIKGLKKKEIIQHLSQRKDIDRAAITIRPLWKSKFPHEAKNIIFVENLN